MQFLSLIGVFAATKTIYDLGLEKSILKIKKIAQEEIPGLSVFSVGFPIFMDSFGTRLDFICADELLYNVVGLPKINYAGH